jgi:ADP-heptose:LPS heptosyltransferase
LKEILIINLTRMGDLLQTTPLMAGIKSKYPDSRITILVNSAFTEVCKGIPYIDDLMDFEMKGYFLRLKEGKHSLIENYRILDTLVSNINSKEYDLAVNVTHSSVSAVLVSLIRAKEVRGFTISSEGHRVIKHPWVRYFFNVIPNRNYNPFHIVDMYVKIGDVRPVTRGLVYNVSEEDELKAEQILSKEGVNENDVLVGFHLGASRDEKTWPVSSYAELGDMIQEKYGATIVLFGTPGEADLAAEFEKCAKTRPVNLVGKTGIGELSGVLKKCKLFISNDTGPLHVATLAGTKVIDISMANVHFRETGPYGEGHYVIQADLACSPCGFDVKCNDRVCKSIVTPVSVFEVVRMALTGRDGEKNFDMTKMKQVQVYKSHFKDDGYLDFVPLIQRSLDITELYRIIYRPVMNLESKKINGKIEKVCESIFQEISTSYAEENLSQSLDILQKDSVVLENFVSLTRKTLNIIRHLIDEVRKDNQDINKIKALWKKIESHESEIETIGHTHLCFRPLTLLFMYSKEALEGNDLRALAEKSLDIYEDLLTKSENMLEIIFKINKFLERIVKSESFAMTS